MASRSKSPGLYGNLLRLYPVKFRQQYGEPMAQTFEDMLEAQQTPGGRAKVWLRTLFNLPFSAFGQHMNLKGGFAMSKKMYLALGCVLIALVVVTIGSFWFGHVKTEQGTVVARVSTTELGNAMQQDDFYSQYGSTALLFSGKVASSTARKGLTIVTFESRSAYDVQCRFSTSPHVKTGDTISVVAPGGQAVRQPHGVLLLGCEKP
jgi:hypothetical protein